MLVLCTVFWAVSFPTMKALTLIYPDSQGPVNSWFIAYWIVFFRFLISGLVVAAASWRSLRRLTRSEIGQGLGLGLFGAGGIVLQIDGLAYTTASVSAFLTQCYAVFIPLWVALSHRRWPPPLTWICCLLVMSGVAVLSNLNWHELRLGRGEFETLLASVFFTGQILWLEQPRYAGNRPNHFSVVMFGVMALLAAPGLCLTGGLPEWRIASQSLAAWNLILILVVVCTLGGYLLMNHWQPHVPATQAGLIYCLEPVFASFFAMFLPALYSAWAGISYPNERFTLTLVLGGGLITAANALIQWDTALTGDP